MPSVQSLLFQLLRLLLLLSLLFYFLQLIVFRVHTLVGGGGLHEGFDALDYRKIKHGDASKSANYHILSVLPNKFARVLYEFYDF